MTMQYKLLFAKDQFPRVVDTLESIVADEMNQGWEPFGSLVAYVASAHVCLIQPVIMTSESLAKHKEQKKEARRTYIIDYFPAMLRSQRIIEERAAGKSWEEIGKARGRAASTVKRWTNFYVMWKDDIESDSELKRLYLEYKEAHP